MPRRVPTYFSSLVIINLGETALPWRRGTTLRMPAATTTDAATNDQDQCEHDDAEDHDHDQYQYHHERPRRRTRQRVDTATITTTKMTMATTTTTVHVKAPTCSPLHDRGVCVHRQITWSHQEPLVFNPSAGMGLRVPSGLLAASPEAAEERGRRGCTWADVSPFLPLTPLLFLPFLLYF